MEEKCRGYGEAEERLWGTKGMYMVLSSSYILSALRLSGGRELHDAVC